MADEERPVDEVDGAPDDTTDDTTDDTADDGAGDDEAGRAAEPAEATNGDTGDDEQSSARDKLRELGSYIRDQRSRAEYSLRHLARLAGVSNPYLSQIERGLRKPSAEILQGIAKALQISSETLYVKAGILEERPDEPDLEFAIQRDDSLNERQRAALVEIYRSFRRENVEDESDTSAAAAAVAAAATGQTVADSGPTDEGPTDEDATDENSAHEDANEPTRQEPQAEAG